MYLFLFIFYLLQQARFELPFFFFHLYVLSRLFSASISPLNALFFFLSSHFSLMFFFFLLSFLCVCMLGHPYDVLRHTEYRDVRRVSPQAASGISESWIKREREESPPFHSVPFSSFTRCIRAARGSDVTLLVVEFLFFFFLLLLFLRSSLLLSQVYKFHSKSFF